MGRPRKIKTEALQTDAPSLHSVEGTEAEAPLVSGIALGDSGDAPNGPGDNSGAAPPAVAPEIKRKYTKKTAEVETVPVTLAPEIAVRALYGVLCSVEVSIAAKKAPQEIAEEAFAPEEKHLKIIMVPVQEALAPLFAMMKGGEKWVALVASLYQVESEKFRRFNALMAAYEQKRLDVLKTPGPAPGDESKTMAAAAGSDGLLPN